MGNPTYSPPPAPKLGPLSSPVTTREDMVRRHLAWKREERAKRSLRGATIMVTGSTRYRDVAAIWTALDQLHLKKRVAFVMVRGTGGVSAVAVEWAKDHGALPMVYGKDPAVPIEKVHEDMIGEEPDGCVAFPGGRLTADLVDKATAAGIAVWRPYG